MSIPGVSVVMPVRDEAASIAMSLRAVLAQDYPTDRLEVIVVDGGSTDDTVEVVREVAASSDVPVTLLRNADRIVPTGLNLGIRQAGGDVVVRVDGHCVIAPDYVGRCVETLGRTRAACVGGVIETVGETPIAQAIAVAQSSRFGVGGVAFRVGREEAGPVDTVPFGAYRREVFDRFGGFDVELVRDQDDDFNYRLVRAGQTVWLDPSIRSRYLSRASLRGLWRQYMGYGYYKVRVLQKNGLSSARHLVPAAFVVGLASSAVAAVGTRDPRWLAVVAGPYALVAPAVAGWTAVRRRVGVPSLLASYAIIHIAYGVGFLAGIWRWRSGFLRSDQADRRRPGR